MNIKIASYALVWFGVIALLGSIHLIRVDAGVLLSTALIVAGLSLKHYNHSLTCAVGGKCDACGKGSHKCEGDDCATCKVK